MTSTDQRLQIAASDDNTSFALAGELDAHTATQLDTMLAATEPSASIDLDLSAVTFLDSSGLRTLVAQHAAREEQGGALVLRSPSPSVVKLLDITGLTDHLRVDPTS